MEPEKMTSMAKTVKWVMVLLGVVAMLLAALSLLLKTEDPSVKTDILVFASFGLSGIVLMVLGLAFHSLFESLKSVAPKTESEDDVDILA